MADGTIAPLAEGGRDAGQDYTRGCGRDNPRAMPMTIEQLSSIPAVTAALRWRGGREAARLRAQRRAATASAKR